MSCWHSDEQGYTVSIPWSNWWNRWKNKKLQQQQQRIDGKDAIQLLEQASRKICFPTDKLNSMLQSSPYAQRFAESLGNTE